MVHLGLAVGRVLEHVRERHPGQGQVPEHCDLGVQADADPAYLELEIPLSTPAPRPRSPAFAGGGAVQVGLCDHREKRLTPPGGAAPAASEGDNAPFARKEPHGYRIKETAAPNHDRRSH